MQCGHVAACKTLIQHSVASQSGAATARNVHSSGTAVKHSRPVRTRAWKPPTWRRTRCGKRACKAGSKPEVTALHVSVVKRAKPRVAGDFPRNAQSLALLSPFDFSQFRPNKSDILSFLTVDERRGPKPPTASEQRCQPSGRRNNIA